MRDIAPTGVRMPDDLKAKLQQSAKDNGRSLNSEIVARLTASYDNEIGDKLDEILRVLKLND
ncbi:Arc family DNA-binding protein [Moraxella bovis]|uniref:Arc-like DNA binding domain n=1 Tax=Moraxella bovis TaxID=476 RepID=A0A378PYA4_MORBO|nr:Arc family DNA-binding protein [Moraxella bovis]STY93395.1 Arc-like DNA binding domain [Moraxella bovis]